MVKKFWNNIFYCKICKYLISENIFSRKLFDELFLTKLFMNYFLTKSFDRNIIFIEVIFMMGTRTSPWMAEKRKLEVQGGSGSRRQLNSRLRPRTYRAPSGTNSPQHALYPLARKGERTTRMSHKIIKSRKFSFELVNIISMTITFRFFSIQW